MSGGNGNGKKVQLIHDASSIYYLHPSEAGGVPLTKYFLTGENYDVWEKAIINALEGRNKYGFITGEFAKPSDEKSPEFSAWKSNNSIICSWLFNSIDITIQPSIVSHKIAKEMWDDLKERYSISNGPRLNQLKSLYHSLRQKGMAVVAYYNKFKALWDELYGSEDITCGCTCAAAPKLRARAERDKTHDFLLGLDDDQYGPLRTQILSTDPFPNLGKAFSLVTQEERHKTIIRDRDDKTSMVSFAAQSSLTPPTSKPTSPSTYNPVTCTYCGRTGHDYERCFQRIGYPNGLRGRGRGRPGRGRGGSSSSGRGQHHIATANVATAQQTVDTSPLASTSGTASSIPGLSAEQVQRLLTLLDTSPSSEHLHGKNSSDSSVWLLDSGASHHMTGTLEYLFDCIDLPPSPVSLPNGVQTLATKQGSVNLASGLVLRNVLYVPNIKCSLISIGRLISDNTCLVTFTDCLCVIQDRTSRMPIGLGKFQHGVYYFRPVTQQILSNAMSTVASPFVLHQRLGHPSSQALSYISNSTSLSNIKKCLDSCDVCPRAKQTRSVFALSDNKAAEIFDLIHCDLWGPYSKSSTFGAHYFLSIVDDFSRAVWVYLLIDKIGVASSIRNFFTMIKTQFGKTIKTFRSDNGTEFTQMRAFFDEQGTLFQTSCVSTPQQNGRVERKHRHILNVARAIRFQGCLPIEFWADCVHAAVFVINRTPSRILNGKTPYELLFGSAPHYSMLRIIGCLCYAHNNPQKKDKFGSRSRKCVFLGYPYGQKGWKVYDLATKEVFVSRDVQFHEDIFPFADTPTVLSTTTASSLKDRHACDWEFIMDNTPSSTIPISELLDRGSSDPSLLVSSNTHIPASTSTDPILPEQPSTITVEQSSPTTTSTGALGQRDRRPPSYLKDYVCHSARTVHPISVPPISVSSGTRYPIANFVTYDKFSFDHRKFLAAVSTNLEPRSYKEAAKDECWRVAMKREIDALHSNNTWDIVDLPPGRTPIGCKWVYKTKYNSDGSLERHKARLVVLGNHQKEGEDFSDTFAPVAKMVSVRTFLAVAVAKKWEIHQLDVNNAFLHGDLHEKVYMSLPPGFLASSPTKVCRLRKSLYGLKQSPRNWFAKLTTALRQYGFIQSHADHTLFTYRKGNDVLSILVYVDDILVAGNNVTLCTTFKRYLDRCFQLKDLGPLKYFLGIEFARSSKGLTLSQRKYTLDILQETGLLASKPVDTPLPQNHKLASSTSALYKDPARYRRIVGRLIYLTLTRPDISYPVHILSQFMHEPLIDHYDAALRVLRYLKGHPGQGLLLSADSDLQLYAYCDSDWASCPVSRRSLSGYFILLGHSPISWKTKKQTTVSRSSAEAEYRAMAFACAEIKWIRYFLASLGVFHREPVRLFCDNQAALHIAANPVFHERTKHIELDCHFVRELLVAGIITTAHVPTKLQLADLFTKALGAAQFSLLLSKLGVIDLHTPA